MNKICGYSCEHNKGGVCQITMCDKQIYITNRTNEQKQIKSKENITIIKTLNNFGRVPEQHELLDEIETLQQELQGKDNIINELEKWLEYEIYCDFSNEMTKAYQDSLDKIKELENDNKL